MLGSVPFAPAFFQLDLHLMVPWGVRILDHQSKTVLEHTGSRQDILSTATFGFGS